MSPAAKGSLRDNLNRHAEKSASDFDLKRTTPTRVMLLLHFARDVYEGHATEVEPRSYRSTANICRSSLLNGTSFTPSIWFSRRADAAKMSHRPQ